MTHCWGALPLVNKCQWETAITQRAVLSTSLLTCFSCQPPSQRSWQLCCSFGHITNGVPIQTSIGQERQGHLQTAKQAHFPPTSEETLLKWKWLRIYKTPLTVSHSLIPKPLEVGLWGGEPKSGTIGSLFAFSLTPLCSLWTLLECTAGMQKRNGICRDPTMDPLPRKTCRPPS